MFILLRTSASNYIILLYWIETPDQCMREISLASQTPYFSEEREKGSGNTAYNEFYLAKECGATNEIASLLIISYVINCTARNTRTKMSAHDRQNY